MFRVTTALSRLLTTDWLYFLATHVLVDYWLPDSSSLGTGFNWSSLDDSHLIERINVADYEVKCQIRCTVGGKTRHICLFTSKVFTRYILKCTLFCIKYLLYIVMGGWRVNDATTILKKFKRHATQYDGIIKILIFNNIFLCYIIIVNLTNTFRDVTYGCLKIFWFLSVLQKVHGVSVCVWYG